VATATVSRKSSSKPTARIARFHPALVGGTSVCAKTDQRADPISVHFRQGDVDSSCGLCCVNIALATLGVIKASALESQTRRRFGLASKVWRAFQPTFFTGINAPELYDALRSLALPLRLTMRHAANRKDISSHRAVSEFALSSLRGGALVMLAYRSLANGHQHWILATGCGGFEVGRRVSYETIYVLDPSNDTLALAVYNSVLTRTERKGTAHPAWNLECGAGYVVPVTLISAIRFDRV
jgi:hypothetical protein